MARITNSNLIGAILLAEYTEMDLTNGCEIQGCLVFYSTAEVGMGLMR